MNIKGNNNIPSSTLDDVTLTTAAMNACESIREKYLRRIPDTWNFECGTKKITFKDIRDEMISEGINPDKAESYYGGPSSIETDANIIYLTMNIDGKIVRKPIFMGEMKKQGTNDRRLMEGKKKQAIGNAAPDRVAKNYEIFADFCYNCDCNFFPYNVFLHGCDFSDDEMTGTMRGKLSPFFGDLNVFNPYFDKDVRMSLKGGCCYYQEEDFTVEQLYDYVYKCCEEGIKYFLCKFGEEE